MATKKKADPLEQVNRKLLRMAERVNAAVEQSITALADKDLDLAARVVAADDKIDAEEVRIEKDCIKLLTGGKLSAGQVRYVLCLIKINADLERMADCACNIAERLDHFIQRDAPPLPAELRIMANSAVGMMHDAVRAWIDQDADQALQVMRADDVIDNLYDQLVDELGNRITGGQEPDNSIHYMGYLMAARNFERIADHATNVAECTVLSATGEIVRHQAIRVFVD